MQNWYSKSLPKIKDIKPYLNEIVANLKKTQGVNNISVWGSYASNFTNPNYRIKDVDLLLETNFHSEDLVSIDKTAISTNNTKEELEENGFDPAAIHFSEEISKLKSPLIDPWAISKDKKLLHWGPIFSNKSESDTLKKEAEEFASQQTGFNLAKIKHASDNKRTNWYKTFHDYYSKQISDMPSGWYESEEDISKLDINSKRLG